MNKEALQAGFYLEDWFVEPELARLTREREIVQLEPKIMSVLLLLAENQGKVVKKEEFFKTIWADINVTEHVLARAISEIRRIFNDNPQNARVIQTLSKNGYRLIAPVSTEKHEEADQNVWEFNAPQFSPQPALQVSATNLLFFFGGVFIVIVFAVMLFIIFITKHSGGGAH